MERPDYLPVLYRPGVQTRQFESYDPSGGNADYSMENAFYKAIDANGEYVIFDEVGAGCLYRQHFNIWTAKQPKGKPREQGPGEVQSDVMIKYYFDGEHQPRLAMPIDDFFSGRTKPFDAPFGFQDTQYRFGIQYYPFEFEKRLKITLAPNAANWLADKGRSWYQYTYLTYPDTEGVVSWQGRSLDSATVRRQWSQLGQDPKDRSKNRTCSKAISVLPGQTGTLFEASGAGCVNGIRLTMKPFTEAIFYDAVIRIYWDGSSEAAVDLPLGYLFGGGGREYPIREEVWRKTLRTLMFGFNGDDGTFYCYWPMPYRKGARIEICNGSGRAIEQLKSDIEYAPEAALCYPLMQAGYFCAKRTLDEDVTGEYRAIAFKEKGAGHVVGLTFYSDGYDMDGDQFVYFDDSFSPGIHGNGTEDDHNQGWGGDAYQKPLWGGLINGYDGAYRIFLNDPYIFYKNICIAYEYSKRQIRKHKKYLPGGKTDVTVFYYKSPEGANLDLTDEVDVGNTESETAHAYQIDEPVWRRTLTSDYDGYERNTDFGRRTDDGRAYRGYSQFIVQINPDNAGVRIRRRLLREDSPVQIARVIVDGQAVSNKPWQVVTLSKRQKDNDFDGWYNTDYFIPASYTHGKDKITVKIETADSAHNEINDFYYWIYCYRSKKGL